MEKFIVRERFTVVLIVTFALGMFLPAIVHAESFAVLFSGGGNKNSNYDRYYEETLRMWEITTQTLGYDVDNVYVLFADGIDTGDDRCVGWDTDGNCNSWANSDWSDITNAGGNIMSGTAANLQSVFADLSGIMGAEDCFDFWSFDHGGNTTYDLDDHDPPYSSTRDEGYLVGWGNIISDDTFASWVDPFNVKAEAYAFAQCFAGDMADDLFDLDGSEHRFAAWAASWFEPSYGKGWADAWADGLEAGLRGTHELGRYAVDNDPYGWLGTGQEHPGYRGANFDIITNEPIPEPSTVVLLGFGLIALTTIGRKKCKKG